MKNCNSCPEDEKKAILKARLEERAKDGPSHPPRGHKAALQQQTADESDLKSKVAGRLRTPFNRSFSSFPLTNSDGEETVSAKGRIDDGSDESIVSPKLADSAVLNGTGKLKKIAPVTL